MDNFVLIDGNSIMNRAFYGIMGSKMLTTKDGKYTNAVYGFLAILFKLIEDTNPKYMAVAFDLKAPTARHKLYEGYKANRKGMPEELAEQMPLIKEILRAMNIDIVEKEGYEADDVLGTLSRYGEKQGLHVTILSGDRDTFQLATENVTIRIPRTKGGKTETDLFDRNKIIETYGIEPKQLIEVKGLQGDSSDNIPGVPGVGEKTALSLIQKYGSIENLYDKVEKNEDDLKGKQREKIIDNKELAELSRTLGTINLEVPIEDTLEQFKVEEWDKGKVLKLFKELNFNRYIERFHLTGEKNSEEEEKYKIEFKTVKKSIEEIMNIIKAQKNMVFYLQTEADELPENIIKEKITGMSLYNTQTQEAYYIKLKPEEIGKLKDIFEDADIKKTSINLTKVYILLKQADITLDVSSEQTETTTGMKSDGHLDLLIDQSTSGILNVSISGKIDLHYSGSGISFGIPNGKFGVISLDNFNFSIDTEGNPIVNDASGYTYQVEDAYKDLEGFNDVSFEETAANCASFILAWLNSENGVPGLTDGNVVNTFDFDVEGSFGDYDVVSINMVTNYDSMTNKAEYSGVFTLIANDSAASQPYLEAIINVNKTSEVTYVIEKLYRGGSNADIDNLSSSTSDAIKTFVETYGDYIGNI